MSIKKQVYGGKTSRSNSKQSVSNPMSVRKRFSSLCSPPNNQVQSACVFCQKFQNQKVESYSHLLNKALFAKYSSSQNYYYSKDINDIIDEESTPAVVFYRDLECIVEEEEYLKRSYAKKESTSKIKALLEYYKYHKDIPRLFMQKVYYQVKKSWFFQILFFLLMKNYSIFFYNIKYIQKNQQTLIKFEHFQLLYQNQKYIYD